MELLFVLVIAASLGLIISFASRDGRTSYGVLLAPAVDVVLTAVVWVVLLWLGFTFDGGWIWLISLVVGGVGALVLALRLPGARAAADKALLAELSARTA
jgi:hypothetical protein